MIRLRRYSPVLMISCSFSMDFSPMSSFSQFSAVFSATLSSATALIARCMACKALTSFQGTYQGEGDYLGL